MVKLDTDKAPAKKAVAKKAVAKKKVANRPKTIDTAAKLPEQAAAEEYKPKPLPTVETHGLADVEEKLRLMVYGAPGVGKTTLALQAAQFGKVILIDADRGAKKRALVRAGIKVENVEVYDGEISYEALDALHQQLEERMAGGEEIFAIVWDTITMTMPWLVEASVAEGVKKAAKLKRHRSSTDVYVEDYGVMTQQMKQLICRRFMDLDCHLILTAHEQRDKDDNGAVRIMPDITPSLGSAIAGAMDQIIALRAEITEDGEESRYAYTRPMERYEAKDRFSTLPPTMPEPGFAEIMELNE